ncbi:tonB-system energizer ExbB [Hyphomicrobium sp. 1Nfss2.1]|uniref:tonB-system energizer ExbB n=1 Tax=Hyphomicrobium sp. 1Nfss2.1 TaxID=3413936 RepID=UPI003C7B1367
MSQPRLICHPRLLLVAALSLAGCFVAHAQEAAAPAAAVTQAGPAATVPVATPPSDLAAPAPSLEASPSSAGAQAPAASPAPAAPAFHGVAGPAAATPEQQVPVATATPVATAAPAHNPNKPHDLSPWGMFLQADIVVKGVMLGLLSASLVCWTVWLAKTIELSVAKRRLRHQLKKLAAANSLLEAVNLISSTRGAVPAMLQAALAETRASWDIADRHAIKERISARLDRVDLAAGRDINRGTGILATIGSTSPFIGLFGTVWGIMNSFIGISEAQTTNLAIVAPGIAEALLATAFGLVAAIPAVIIYNHFSRSIGGYKALVGDASVLVLGLASRDFDRGVRPELRAAE